MAFKKTLRTDSIFFTSIKFIFILRIQVNRDYLFFDKNNVANLDLVLWEGNYFIFYNSFNRIYISFYCQELNQNKKLQRYM